MTTFRGIVDERLRRANPGVDSLQEVVVLILRDLADEMDRQYPEPERGGGDLTEEQLRTISQLPSGTYTVR